MRLGGNSMVGMTSAYDPLFLTHNPGRNPSNFDSERANSGSRGGLQQDLSAHFRISREYCPI